MNLDSYKICEKTYISPFYTDLIKTWIKCGGAQTKEPITYFDVRKQIIWGNKYIKYKGNCLLMENWIKDGIIFINDILDNNGTISEKVVLSKLSVKQNWIAEFSMLKNAIPKIWQQKIQTEESVKTKVNVNWSNDQIIFFMKNLVEFKNKNIYNVMLIKVSSMKPLGFSIWMKKLYIQHYSDFEIACNFIFTHLRDNKFKVFRWKLLHYILPCKELLCKWKISSDDKCKKCKVQENYYHFFFECRRLESFWNVIKTIFLRLKLGGHIFTLKNFVIGYKLREGICKYKYFPYTDWLFNL